MSGFGRDMEAEREKLRPLVKPVGDLSRASGRRLGNRPMEPVQGTLSGQESRDIILEAPNAKRLIRISETDYGQRSEREIEVVDNPSSERQASTRRRTLPDTVVEDPLQIGDWDGVGVDDIRSLQSDVEKGRELTTPEGRARYNRAAEQGRANRDRRQPPY